MNSKRIIAVLLTFAMILTFIQVPALALSMGGGMGGSFTREGVTLAPTVTNPVKPTGEAALIWDDFEDGDISDWYERNSAQGTVKGELVTENGNNFLRFGASEYTTKTGKINEEGGVISRKFDGAVSLPSDGYTVIEGKLRTNGNEMRKYVLYNYPYPGSEVGGAKNLNYVGDIGYNNRTVMSMNWSAGKFATATSNVGSGSAIQGSNAAVGNAYALNAWYKFVVVWDHVNNKQSTYIYQADGTLFGALAGSSARSMDAWWFNYEDYTKTMPLAKKDIYDISLVFRNTKTTTDFEYVDIDDFKITTYKQKADFNVLNNTDIGIIYKPQEIMVKFDSAVENADASGAVKILNASGAEVPHTPVFDKYTGTYTAKFDTILEKGNYSVVVDPAKITFYKASQVNASFTTSFKKTECAFKVYDSMPPVARNVTVAGRNYEGQTLSASFDYEGEGAEGNHIYEWYIADSKDGEKAIVSGASTKDIAVSDYPKVIGNYVYAKVAPVDASDLTGASVWSDNCVVPEKAPVVSNVKASPEILFENSTLSVTYDYFDENGDEEDGTTYQWFTGSSNEGPWEPIGTEPTVSIGQGTIGKYYKCILNVKNGATVSPSAETVEVIAGPVADIVEASNLLKNPGFEAETIEPWKPNSHPGLQVVEDPEIAYEGNKVLHMPPRTAVSEGWYQSVPVVAGKTYILSAMAKKVNENDPDFYGLEGYVWEGKHERPYREEEKITVTKDWQRVTFTMQPTETKNFKLTFTSFNTLATNAYIDNTYLGELLISDFNVAEIVPTKIPEEDSILIPVSNGEIYNQFGETDGLIDQEIQITIPEGTKGVKVVRDSDTGAYSLEVTSRARAGIIPVNMKVVPTYPGPAQASFEKTTEIELLPSDNKTPVADDVKIEGQVDLGSVLTGSYSFYQADSKEDASTYQWKYSDKADGEYLPIEGATGLTYTVEEAYVDKYIKFCVTPKTTDGLEGVETMSEAATKPTVPVARNVKLSGQFKFGGIFKGSYEFFDANVNDVEENSIYKWYVSNTETGEYTLIEGETENTFTFTEDYEGKWIKFSVTPASNNEPNDLEKEYFSAPVKLVKDILEETNLFKNPSFEDGLKSWTIGKHKLELIEDEGLAHSGNMVGHLYGRGAVGESWYQSVQLENGKTYVLSAMVRKFNKNADNIIGYEGYPWSDIANRPFRDDEYTLVTNEWTRVTLTMHTKAGGTANLGFTSFQQLGAEVYIDDCYVGELLITDAEVFKNKPIEIPTEGSVMVPIATGTLYNQFGDTKGLKNETISIVVPEGTRGIEAVNQDGVYGVMVTDRAQAGTAEIIVSCTPSYPGAAQEVFEKVVEIELLPNSNTTPVADDVKASGTVAEGEVLTGSYSFYQIEGKEDASTYQWKYSDTENGAYQAIPGATELTYTVTEEYKDKFIKFSVTPKTTDGLNGRETLSNLLTVPTTPSAENITVTGDIKVGGELKGSYVYKDVNVTDSEANTAVKWLISDTENGSYAPITDANTDTLVLTDAMIDKYIKFCVIPESDNAPNEYKEYLSSAVFGPTRPVARDVSIKKDGLNLKAQYTYYHPHNSRETGTTYEWKSKGQVLSNSAEYVIDFTGTRTIELTITPACDSNPAKGEPVTVSMSVTGKSQSLGGGGGGGGGSSFTPSTPAGSTSGLTNINDMQYNKPEEEPEEEPEAPKSDIASHWGKSYIENMASRGVMTADANGNFDPDKNSSRQEMLTYLFKALKLETTDYNNEFKDVSDGEFAKMLQTMVNNGTIAKDENFRPNDTISREEMCKILYVSLNNAGKLKEVEGMQIEAFADFDKVADWAKVYVNAIYGNKIMVGVSDAEFDPKGTVTKAQAATMLTRILALVEQ